MSKQIVKKYELNDRILCLTSDNLPYEAKIIEVTDVGYKIHYQGWHKRYDELVLFENVEQKFSKFSEEALRKAKEQVKAAMKNNPISGSPVSNNSSKPGTPGGKAGRQSAKRKNNETLADNSEQDIKFDTICELPKELKQILVEDYTAVDDKQLYKLPTKYSVENIIKDYCTNVKQILDDSTEVVIEYENDKCITSTANKLITSSQGIIEYFNSLLSSHLLYKFEKLQHTTHSEKKKSKDRSKSISANPSSLYGLPHLLRLLSSFDEYIQHTQWNSSITKALGETLADFMKFLVKNKNKYFDLKRDYHSATSEYLKEVEK